MRHTAYTLRTVFGYYPTPETRSTRPRFLKRLSPSQYSLLVGLIDSQWTKFDKGATESNVILFGALYRQLPKSAQALRLVHHCTGTVIAPFSDSDYLEVRELLNTLSGLKNAGYFAPSPSFKIPPQFLRG